jgi:hypothetical protein
MSDFRQAGGPSGSDEVAKTYNYTKFTVIACEPRVQLRPMFANASVVSREQRNSHKPCNHKRVTSPAFQDLELLSETSDNYFRKSSIYIYGLELNVQIS